MRRPCTVFLSISRSSTSFSSSLLLSVTLALAGTSGQHGLEDVPLPEVVTPAAAALGVATSFSSTKEGLVPPTPAAPATMPHPTVAMHVSEADEAEAEAEREPEPAIKSAATATEKAPTATGPADRKGKAAPYVVDFAAAPPTVAEDLPGTRRDSEAKSHPEGLVESTV